METRFHVKRDIVVAWIEQGGIPLHLPGSCWSLFLSPYVRHLIRFRCFFFVIRCVRIKEKDKGIKMGNVKIGGRRKQEYIKQCLINTYKKKEKIPSALYEKYSFKAPKVFSFIENPHETLRYFNKIINYVSRVEKFVKIRFDLSEINVMTIDAVIYMIAISININSDFKPKFNVLAPEDEGLRSFLLSSGIADYFNAGNIEIKENCNYFNIKMGNKTNVDLAKSICDFTNVNIGKTTKFTGFLYDMLIEMMTNTGQHAYDSKEKIKTQWFIFAENSSDRIRYTFIDTGVGIPTTMSKYMLTVSNEDFEKDGYLTSILNNFADENSADSILLLTGLNNGGFRTRTEKSYRGKGLPEIYNHFKIDRKTDNLKVISGACLCEFDQDDRQKAIVTELSEKFLGTMFYWEIMKEDKNVL